MGKGHERRKAQKRATKQLNIKIRDLQASHDFNQTAYHSTKDRLLFQFDIVEELRKENETLRSRIEQLKTTIATMQMDGVGKMVVTFKPEQDVEYKESTSYTFEEPMFAIRSILREGLEQFVINSESVTDMTDCEGEPYTLDLPAAPTADALRKAMVLDLE